MRARGRLTVAVGLVFTALVAAGCVAGFHGRPLRGPFQGQVVDVETGQPVTGAVALAVWWEVVATPVQGNTRFYDAKEAVTGADGRFEIPQGVPFWNLGVQPGQVSIFAPGYRWEGTRVTPPDGPEFVARTVVQMRQLKTREDRLHNLDRYSFAGVPRDKKPRLLEAMSRERVGLGLSP